MLRPGSDCIPLHAADQFELAAVCMHIAHLIQSTSHRARFLLVWLYLLLSSLKVRVIIGVSIMMMCSSDSILLRFLKNLGSFVKVHEKMGSFQLLFVKWKRRA
jgi:hypothetical protein